MKKILFLILPLFFFLFLAKPSFAQNTTGNPLFDFFIPGTPKTFFNIPDSTKDQTFSLMPFTKIIVTNGTFSENNVNIYVFNGDFDKVKTKVLPKGQSPFASYYFVYTNSQGKLLIPAKSIKIESYNNFVKSLTFFYPLDKTGKIDTQNQTNQPGPVLFKADLPTKDPAFVLAVNKNLSSDDPIFSGNEKETAAPQAKNNQLINTNFFGENKDLVILTSVIVLILITVVVLFFIKKNSPKKNKRIEEPPKIIVGK